MKADKINEKIEYLISPEEDAIETGGKFLIIIVFSPIWLPLWLLGVAYKRWLKW